MTYPDGVELATLTFSVPKTFTGKEVDSVTMEIVSTASVVWAATGEPIVNFPEAVVPGPGLPGSLTVPVVDQAGVVDGAGNVFTMWAYRLTRRARYGGAAPDVETKNWQPLSGQTITDFDLLPDGPIGLPVAVPIPPVTSVAGLTNAVGAAELATELAPHLPTPEAAVTSVADEVGAVGAEALAGKLAPFLPDGVTPETVAANLPARLEEEALTATIATANILDPATSNAVLPWRSAVAKRGWQSAPVLLVGDSTFEGLGLASQDQRVPNLLRDLMRSRYLTPNVLPVGGVCDYIPAYYSTGTAIDATGPVRTAGIVKITSWGLGRHGVEIPSTSTTDSITFTLPEGTTSFQLVVARNAAYVMGVSVDGATVQEITVVQTNSGGFVALDQTVDPSASHTVAVTRISGGKATIEGIHAYRADKASGIRVLDSAQSGNTSAHFGGALAWGQAIGVEKPYLCINGLGYNDYLSAGQVLPSVYKVNMLKMQASFPTQAAPNTPTMLYVSLPEPKISGRTALAPWQEYVEVLAQIAAEDTTGRTLHLDLTKEIPSWAAGSPQGYVQGDNIHPSAAGAAWIASRIEATLARYAS